MSNEPLIQSTTSTPIRSLTEWVVETLRRAIIEGYFEPGERLDQEAISEELEVSRTPLREAIAVLESEGLLTSQSHRGVFVNAVSKKEIGEVFALRALLEAEVVREVAPRVPDSVLDQLEHVLQEAQKAYAEGDQAAQFEADRWFHATLTRLSENSLLREVLAGINNRVSAVRRFAQQKPGPHIREFAEEHLAILDALRRRDAEAAASLMSAHLEQSGERVQRLVELEGSPGES